MEPAGQPPPVPTPPAVPPPLPTPPPLSPAPVQPEPAPRNPGPISAGPISVGLGFASIAIYLAAQVGLQLLLALVAAIAGRPDLATHPIVAALCCLAGVGGSAGFLLLCRCRLAGTFHLSVPRAARTLPAILLLTVGCWILSMEVGLWTEHVLPMPEVFKKLFAELLNAKAPVGLFLAIVVAAPLAEEFICRGILLPALRDRWGTGTALVVSSLAFGAMHLNPWQFGYATLIGLVLGWLRIRTGSVFPGVLMHALNNGISWLLVIRPGILPEGEGLVLGHINAIPGWWLWLAAVLLPVGLLVLGPPVEEPATGTPERSDPNP